MLPFRHLRLNPPGSRNRDANLVVELHSQSLEEVQDSSLASLQDLFAVVEELYMKPSFCTHVRTIERKREA